MSLNLDDLGLGDVVTEIVAGVNSGVLVVIKRSESTPAPNPFSLDTLVPDVPELVGKFPFFGFKDGRSDERTMYGGGERGFLTVKIAIPSIPIITGNYAFINFSNEKLVVPGIIQNVEYRLSSLAVVTVSEINEQPFPWSIVREL